MATFYVYVCLWNVDTRIDRRGNDANELRGLDTNGRYRLMEGVVRHAWLKMLTIRGLHFDEIREAGGDWLYLFVAPEYYFAASDTAHAIPQDEKERVVAWLGALSARLPTLVLCPGTIAWKKPMVRSGAYRFHRGTNIPKESSRTRKFVQRTRAAVEDQSALVSHTVGLDLARYPSLINEREGLISDHLKRARQRGAAEQQMYKNLSTEPDRCFIARNTAYGFYNGREIARYHKRGDHTEVFASESDGGYVIYEPGGGPEGAGDRFNVEGVRFGVEVCLDHQLGYLSQEGAGTPTSRSSCPRPRSTSRRTASSKKAATSSTPAPSATARRSTRTSTAAASKSAPRGKTSRPAGFITPG